MKQILFSIVVMLTVILVSTIYGQVPGQITCQGMLTDTDGHMVPDGNYVLTFRIYDAAVGGNELWVETQVSVQVANGLFNAILGDANPITLAFDTEYWLGIQIGGEAELWPRIKLTSVGYSFRANFALDADKVDGKHADEFAALEHQHDDRYYLEKELTTSDGTPPNEGSNLVSWNNLTDVPVGFADSTDDVGAAGGISQIDAGTGIEVTNPTGPTATVAHAADASTLPDAHHTKTTDASELTSGTLNNARFSAYDDLSSERKIGPSTDKVAAGDHNHDAAYVNETQANSITSGMIVDGTIQQDDLSFGFPDGHSLDAADGSPVDVVYVDNTGKVGIGTDSPTSKLHSISSAHHGLHGEVSGTGLFGVFGHSTGYTGRGVAGDASGAFGLGGSFGSTTYRGLYAVAADGHYAGYFADDIYTTGCTGCGTMYAGLNDDILSLEVGDVVAVSGVSPPLTGPTPIIKVRRADGENSGSVIGVVRSRYVFEEIEGRQGPEMSERFDLESKSIAPGEYLSIVIQGMAQIKVDASFGIVQPGNALTPSTVDGSAMKAYYPSVKTSGGVPGSSNPIIGKALEPMEAGSGLIWAMITLQ